MAQFFGAEKITKLLFGSVTTVQLPNGSFLKLGGQGQYLNSTLTCNTAVSGAGGIDTGSVAASTLYYVYAVYNSTVLSLVASTSATAPVGFNSYRKIGAFYTDGSSNVFKTYYIGEINNLVYSAFVNGSGVPSQESPINWINGNGTMANPANSFTLTSGIFSVRPNFVVTVDDGSLGTVMAKTHINSSSNTTLFYVTQISSNNTYQAEEIHVVVSKQGIDAVQPDWSLL